MPRFPVNPTPLKRDFERDANENIQQRDQGQAPQDEDADDSNIKKHNAAATALHHEDEDFELCEKKDRPPRFSTVFGGAPLPIPLERETRRDKKSGVFLPMPLFVLLVLILFFESTLLFTYTIIGLYNNRPAGLLPSGTTPINGCNCADKQAGIHIAPNFVMGQSTVTVTVTASRAAILPDAQTSATSTSSLNEAKAEASIVKSILSTLLSSPSTTTTSPKSTVTTTANPNIATSTKLIEVGANGKPLPPVTILSTKTVQARDRSTTTIPKADNTENASSKATKSSKKSAANAKSGKLEHS